MALSSDNHGIRTTVTWNVERVCGEEYELKEIRQRKWFHKNITLLRERKGKEKCEWSCVIQPYNNVKCTEAIRLIKSESAKWCQEVWISINYIVGSMDKSRRL